MTSDPGPGRPRLCVRCWAPASYVQKEASEDLCELCGVYQAGEHHGRATVARDHLIAAAAELLAAALTREHIDAMTSGEAEGVQRHVGPDIAHPDDPRPWVRHLLEPITLN